jgi:hypothetical protein
MPTNATRTTRRKYSDVEAPAVLADVCTAFAAHQAEPGICGQCGWLEDDHRALIDAGAATAA